MEIFIYIIIGILVLLGAYYFVGWLNKKNVFKKQLKIKKEKKPEQKHVKTETLRLAEKYMYRREVKMLVALNQVLPRQYLSLPKVALGNIFEPDGNKILYNKIKDQFVDFVVFDEASMKPLAVVDVYDNSFEDELIKDANPELYEILKTFKLPVVEIAVRGEVDTQQLKEKLNAALNIQSK
jgi:hypothetical protein